MSHFHDLSVMQTYDALAPTHCCLTHPFRLKSVQTGFQPTLEKGVKAKDITHTDHDALAEDGTAARYIQAESKSDQSRARFVQSTFYTNPHAGR